MLKRSFDYICFLPSLTSAQTSRLYLSLADYRSPKGITKHAIRGRKAFYYTVYEGWWQRLTDLVINWTAALV